MGRTIPKQSTTLVGYRGIGDFDYQLTRWLRSERECEFAIKQLKDRPYELRRKVSGHHAVFINKHDFQTTTKTKGE